MKTFLTSDKTEIFYNIKGSGKPIIFIHGFAARSNVFRIPQRILSKEYLTLSYDLRGHGLSRESQEDLSMEILARDLYEIIAYLKLKDVTLVGWSMGGSVIFEYINKYDCKNLEGIVIVDTGPKVVNTHDWELGLLNIRANCIATTSHHCNQVGDYDTLPINEQGTRPLREAGEISYRYKGLYDEEDAKVALDLMMESWSKYSEQFMKNMAPNLDDKQLDMAIASMEENEPKHMISVWKDLVSKDYRNILSKIHIPTMIIMGGKSNLYSRATGEYLKENISNSELLMFEGCGHLLVQENPTRFSRAIKNFML